MVTLIRYMLFPFSLLYGAIIACRNILFNHNILKSSKFDVKTILVGNIAVGGTGKTPHVEYLIELLNQKKVATLSRGYGRKVAGFQQASSQSTSDSIGDEPLQFFTKFPDISVFVDASRVNGIIQIMSQDHVPEVILLDDAFQHRALKVGLSILLTDYNTPFYRDYMLPTGNLREFRQGKNRADILIVSKCPPAITEIEMNEIRQKVNPNAVQKLFFTKVKYGEFKPVFSSKEKFKLENRDIIAITGIAKSAPFLTHLETQNRLIKHFNFPDHHRFTNKDIQEIIVTFESNNKALLVTTEKDAMRLKEFKELESLPIGYLPIKIEFLQQEEQFKQLIHSYVESN